MWLQLLNMEYSPRSPNTIETQGILVIAQRAQTEQRFWISNWGCVRKLQVCVGSNRVTLGQGERPWGFLSTCFVGERRGGNYVGKATSPGRDKSAGLLCCLALVLLHVAGAG